MSEISPTPNCDSLKTSISNGKTGDNAHTAQGISDINMTSYREAVVGETIKASTLLANKSKLSDRSITILGFSEHIFETDGWGQTIAHSHWDFPSSKNISQTCLKIISSSLEIPKISPMRFVFSVAFYFSIFLSLLPISKCWNLHHCHFLRKVRRIV